MTLAEITKAASDVFLETGAESVDPDYVMASDIPLELSGEAVRSRLCVFVDQRGNEMVMRPDLTLPVASLEASRRMDKELAATAYTYAARAFRLPASKGDPLEFTQVGFEWFGEASTPSKDANAFLLVNEAVRATGVETLGSATGDLRLFPSVVDALSLPPLMADLLKRAFRQEGGVKELIETPPVAPDPDVLNALEADNVLEALSKLLSARGIELIGTRSLEEIAAGLRAKASAANAGGVPELAARALLALQDINCPLVEAPEALERLMREHDLGRVEGVIDAITARIDLISEDAKEEVEKSRFRSGFGRRFTYYDGFVFETFGEHLTGRQPVAAGGRYDGLIAGLSGGKAKASGIGGVVRPDRVLRAKGGAS